MNASLMAHSAYANDKAALSTPRSTEYDVFARITSAIRIEHGLLNGTRALEELKASNAGEGDGRNERHAADRRRSSASI